MSLSLYLGDCLEKMKDFSEKSIDMILCDLPYGTTSCSWDIIIPFEPLWKEYERIIKDNGAIVLFGNEPFSSYLRLSNLNCYKYDWVWIKERPTNIFQIKKRPGKNIENIMIFYKEPPIYNFEKTIYEGKKRTNKVKNGKLGKLIDENNNKVKEYEDDGTRYPLQTLYFKRDILKSNLHPTQKPVALLEFLIKTYTNKNDLVLDNCMGSGSTGVACLNTERDFIGIEKDEKYFSIAKERIEKEQESLKTIFDKG